MLPMTSSSASGTICPPSALWTISFFFFQAEDGIRDFHVTGVQTCALPISLLFLCCHPALSPVSQLALTLRAVGGLTTAQVASALMVPEATVAQRISRAKQTIRT